MTWTKDTPPWFVLLCVLLCLLVGWEIRPDALMEDAIKGVIGALLLSLQTKPKDT